MLFIEAASSYNLEIMSCIHTSLKINDFTFLEKTILSDYYY